MAIVPGTRIGAYEVSASLGAGGMGEVFRAHDTRLKRDVALKVLPDSVASDPERLLRFQREAQVLASLNHPNIAHVHGLEESAGMRVLVMEFVPGETLSARLTRGPVPLDDALTIAREIADALEAAHERGVVHRDLKPANIMVMPDGHVKVLDFGLAKAADPATGAESDPRNALSSPTMTSPAMMTAAGMILGTAGYMAPEQAKGRTVDKRADIWAFGVIVYEMVSGHFLFAADSVAETLAAVMTKRPDLSRVPTRLHALLHATLEPDPRRRLRDVGDAFRLLEERAPEMKSQPSRNKAVPIILGGVAATALVLAFLAWTRTAPPPPRVAMRLQINLPAGALPDLGMSLSPDGRRLAFVVIAPNGRNVWVRDLDSFDARPVPGSEGHLTNPLSWSTDGRWLGFTTSGGFQKADLTGGGSPFTIAKAAQIGAAWNDEGTIVFGSNPGRNAGGSLFRVPSSGGEPVAITTVDTARSEIAHHHPSFLPDGRHFLYLRAARPEDRSGIYVGSIDADADKQSGDRLIATTYGPVFFATTGDGGDGYLFFLKETSLMAQRFDPNRLALSGGPLRVATPVGSFNDRGLFSVSRNGTVVYTTAAPMQLNQLTWVDRKGNVLDTIGTPGLLGDIAVSPDGSKAAIIRIDAASASLKTELWLWDLTHGTQSLFWFKSRVTSDPVWSQDGLRLVFATEGTEGTDLYERSVTGTDDARLLLRGTNGEVLRPTSWSPDGSFLLYSRSNPQTASDIFALSMKDGSSTALIRTSAVERDAQFSPDGKWIAYQASETAGQQDVYVTSARISGASLTVGGGPWRVSNGGGSQPLWRADGREIFYASSRSIMAAEVFTSSGFSAGPPVPLLKDSPGVSGVGNVAARRGLVTASRDGQRILLARPVDTGGTARAPVNVLLNWTPETAR